MRPDRRGFTLVELIVAVAMSGLVLLGTAGLIERTRDLSDRIVTVADSAIADAGATDLLFGVTSRAEVPAGELHVFEGDASRASFTSWCERVGGWIERCRARIGFGTGGDGARMLTVCFDSAAPIALARVTTDARLAFLVNGANGAQWFTVWGDGISRPDAIAIVSVDTLVLPLGVDR